MSLTENLITLGFGEPQTLISYGYGGLGLPPSGWGTVTILTVSPTGSSIAGPVYVDDMLLGFAPQIYVVAVGVHHVDFGDITGLSTAVTTTFAIINNGDSVSVTGMYLGPSAFPVGLNMWAVCPYCGGVSDIVRRGSTGVPRSKYGKRQRTYDSDLLYCRYCKLTFRTSAGTIFENMGLDFHGEGLI